ncbi:hypothetical protein AVEN_268721-1 [Araneus ventricosus]|uniref:Uncharacterized protein n=1 Tax=Araneus ventricosus TaxID=182803 RepID=A0A4Y2HSH6_ARAVE|nr:hypothetical protein AVEN_268721-1 [Araneus ventricosus]
MLEFCFPFKIILVLYNFKMPLRAEEALDFLWALDDSDLDDIDNQLVILPPDTDALSDTEDIDDSSTRKIEETICDEQYIYVATIDSMVHYVL